MVYLDHSCIINCKWMNGNLHVHACKGIVVYLSRSCIINCKWMSGHLHQCKSIVVYLDHSCIINCKWMNCHLHACKGIVVYLDHSCIINCKTTTRWGTLIIFPIYAGKSQDQFGVAKCRSPSEQETIASVDAGKIEPTLFFSERPCTSPSPWVASWLPSIDL